MNSLPYAITDHPAWDDFRNTLVAFHETTTIPVGVRDRNGKWLTRLGWQEICKQFHQKPSSRSPTCLRMIRGDDPDTTQSQTHPMPCPYGLTEAVYPIHYGTHYVGTCFVGQFLVETPDSQRFLNQAHQYGYDSGAYLHALADVPVLCSTRVESIGRFFEGLIALLTSLVGETYSRMLWESRWHQISHQLEVKVADRTRELNDALKEMQDMATRDPLTGIFNRRHFEAQLNLEIDRARRHRRPLSLILFDLDHFKTINDTHGHIVGDHAIQSAASAAHTCIRANDCLARWGGEEFVIILPETELTQAAQLAERIRARVCRAEAQFSPTTTCSLGVAEWANETATELMMRTDKAVYKAKMLGRNRVELAEPADPA